MSAGGRPPLDADGILRLLAQHRVRYVLIGGVAGNLHGDQAVTFDLDVVPDLERGNLERLAQALRAMGAGLRIDDRDEPLPFDFDAGSLRRFTTMATRGRYGDLDIVLRPDGIPGGYRQLAENAIPTQATGATILVGALDDLVASRRAAAEMTGLEHYHRAAARLERLAPGRAADDDASRDARGGTRDLG